MAKKSRRKRRMPTVVARREPGDAYPLELRRRVVEQVVEGGASMSGVAHAFGLWPSTVSEWVRRFEKCGADGLMPKPKVPPRRRADTVAARAKREAVVGMRTEHPEYGTRRIRDMLLRFAQLGLSETQVRSILHEVGLIDWTPPAAPREHAPRRFERAEPNQLWQSDIFTFLLRRQQRLYIAAFMDDNSRYLVSHAVAHHQRSELVMEALRRGIAAYGSPREILTDQGRQYTAWRGETDFARELRREGIVHVKSRPQHPQTLGKIERFWKTLWDELLSKTVFADFADFERRLGLYVYAYNHQRTHQAIGGLVPADRFFRAAPQVREAIEKGVAANALEMGRQRPPR